MTPERYKLLTAYADGQLPPEEIRRVDESMTDAERKFVASERDFAAVLRRELSTDRVPDDVWNRIVGKLNNFRGTAVPPAKTGEKYKAPQKRLGWIASIAGAAAAILTVVLYFHFFGDDEIAERAEFITQRAQETLADYQSHIETNPDIAEIKRFAEKYNFNVGFTKLEKALAEKREQGTPFSLLGARMLEYDKMQCVSLLFNCGGQPVQVVLMPKADKRGEEFKVAAKRTDAIVSFRELKGATALYISRQDCCRALLAYLD